MPHPSLCPPAQALSALRLIDHTLPFQALSSLLETLVPRLDELGHTEQLELIHALSGPAQQVSKPTAATFLAALTRSISSSATGGLGCAPSELLLAVVGAAARWRVPLDQGWLGQLEQELVDRLAGEGEGEGDGGSGAPAAVAREQPVLRQQLLSGLIVPLAVLGQELRKVRTAARGLLPT